MHAMKNILFFFRLPLFPDGRLLEADVLLYLICGSMFIYVILSDLYFYLYITTKV